MKYVMRKKPPGKLVSKTAHQVEREYRVIHALEQRSGFEGISGISIEEGEEGRMSPRSEPFLPINARSEPTRAIAR